MLRGALEQFNLTEGGYAPQLSLLERFGQPVKVAQTSLWPTRPHGWAAPCCVPVTFHTACVMANLRCRSTTTGSPSMPAITATDLERMTSALFIDQPFRGRPASRFWTLLILAAVIATAGIMADSTATVIGAMIVAPLMTPILGSALAIVLVDSARVRRSLGLVIGGALVVIAVARVIGALLPSIDSFAANTQVAGRVNPRLVDLLAALATGTVGAFALVRSDISDTLPGVAIAISLVPPLAVVGLLLGVQRWTDAAGAALLFGTNVAAIIATGTIVFLVTNVRKAAREVGVNLGDLRKRSIAVVALGVIVLAIPLSVGTREVAVNESLRNAAKPVVEEWAGTWRWSVRNIEAVDGDSIIVTLIGTSPAPDPQELRRRLNDAGLADINLDIVGVLGANVSCPANADQCRSDNGLQLDGSS